MPTDPALMEAAVMNILMTKQYFAQNAAANGTAGASGAASQGPVATASAGGASGSAGASGPAPSGGAAVATDTSGGASPAAASDAAATTPAASGSLKAVEEKQAWAMAVLAIVVIALM